MNTIRTVAVKQLKVRRGKQNLKIFAKPPFSLQEMTQKVIIAVHSPLPNYVKIQQMFKFREPSAGNIQLHKNCKAQASNIKIQCGGARNNWPSDQRIASLRANIF